MKKMKLLPRHSLENVEAFRNLRKQWPEQLMRGLFYAEGEQIFVRLLESQLEIVSVLLTPDLFALHRRELEGRSCSVVVAEKSWIESNTMQKLNQGILAIARIPEQFALTSLEKLNRFCIVALNGLDHAVNVGTIFRSCAAFGITAAITESHFIHPYSWRAVRASLGGVFQVPFFTSSNFCYSLEFLKNLGTTLIAADPSSHVLLPEMKLPEKICLILGNEHQGISPNVLSLNPDRVAIQMSGKMDSLNVAAASAIFLYHFCRR
jgi:TrmH family RNA methyltransferase